MRDYLTNSRLVLNEGLSTPVASEEEKRIIGRFLFGLPPGFEEPFADVLTVQSELTLALLAFKENLESAFTLGSIPFQLTNSSVLDSRFQQLLAAERIRQLSAVEAGAEIGTNGERAAHASASDRMREELLQADVIMAHSRRTLGKLSDQFGDTDFGSSSAELLRQVLVMSWGAFETLFNDSVCSLLNSKPSVTRDLAHVRLYKEALSSRSLLDGLESAGFDLKSGMGDLLAGLVSLDSLPKMRSVAAVLLPDSELNLALTSKELWAISQQRHLIVHRRGIVDNRYLDRVEDNRNIGEKIVFDSKYVEQSILLLRDIGCLFTKETHAIIA